MFHSVYVVWPCVVISVLCCMWDRSDDFPVKRRILCTCKLFSWIVTGSSNPYEILNVGSYSLINVICNNALSSDVVMKLWNELARSYPPPLVGASTSKFVTDSSFEVLKRQFEALSFSSISVIRKIIASSERYHVLSGCPTALRWMRLWCNDSDKGKYLEKIALWCHFVQLKILSGPGSNSIFRG